MPSRHHAPPLFVTTRIPGLLLCLSALLGVSISRAEDATVPSETDFLAELPIVISASRLSQPQNEAPVATTLITREMIDASGATEIPDLFRLIPGFQVAHVNANMFAVSYHGLTFDFPRGLQVLIDGRSVYRPLLSNVDWITLGIAMDDIERIEVVRGPNGAVHGTNAVVGTINIITLQPAESHGGSFHVTGGSNETQDWVERVGGAFGKLDAQLTLEHRKDSGWWNADDARNIGTVAVRGAYQGDVHNRVDMQLGYSGGIAGRWGDPTDPLNPPGDKQVTSAYGMLRWTHARSVGEEVHIQLYQHNYHQRDRLRVGPLSAIVEVPPSYIPLIFGGQPDQYIDYGEYDGRTKRTDLELQHTTQPASTLRIAWGGGYRHDAVDSEVLLDSPRTVTDDSARVFANTEWRPWQNTVVNLGAMTEHNDLVGTHTSPRIAFNQHLNQNHTLRVGAARGYRSPSLYEQYQQWVARANDGELLHIWRTSTGRLKPERLTSYDLGYLFETSSRNLTLDLKAYQEKQDDIIVAPREYDYPVPYLNIANLGNATDGAQVWQNNGHATTRGFEAGLSWHMHRTTFLHLAYAYAKVEGETAYRLNHPSRPDQYTNLEYGVPEHTLSALLDHEWANDMHTSLAFYRTSEMEWYGAGDHVDGHSRVDFRWAKDYKLSVGTAQLELIAQNLQGPYMEFETANLFERRVYARVGYRR